LVRSDAKPNSNLTPVSMSATAISLLPDENAETVDFLRRLASMMSGGKNAEMLLGAASMIEALSSRAMTAEQLYSEQQDEREKNNELRQVAEIAADNLNSEMASLKAQLAEAARQAEIDRASFAEEEHRLSTRAEDAEARLAKVNAELDELRTPFAELSDTVVAVPTEQLRLARAQFDFLADGFARHGDVISQTICEIGRCAIEQALTGSEPAGEAN
jgi:protein required for attachment to host cells